MIATAVALSAVAAGPTAATTGVTDDVVDEAQAGPIAVSQDGQCMQIDPYGTGTRTVEQFYDYRSPNTNPSGEMWGSYGTQDLQVENGSVLLFYEGVDGVSLVTLHDKIGESNGGTATFNIDGLPQNGEVAVEDDEYDDRVDNFDYFENGTEAAIDWKWGPDRGDGWAFRGVDMAQQDPIVIEPGFNEDADKWDSWTHTGPAHRTKGWYLRTADGGVQELDMNTPVEIQAGACPGGPSPMAVMSHGQIQNDGTVQFTVNASYSEGTIDRYEWDLTGNGEPDETTQEPTVTREFLETGLYTIGVTVVATDGTESTVEKNLIVEEDANGNLEITNSEASSGGDVDNGNDETTTDPGSDETTEGPTNGDDTTTAGGTDEGNETTTDDTTEGTPGPGLALALLTLLATVLLAARRRRTS